jgi:protein SCO1/2
LLLFFGYLSCPDVCPTTIFDYGEALDLVPADLADRVSFGMVSVDAERDQGPQIVDYVARFIDDGLGLLPAAEDGLSAAAEAFGLQYEVEHHDEGTTQYLVGHTATVFAIDEDGMIVWEFTYPTPAEDISAALADLFEERY